ncbi:zinc-binding dehydrogenase [Streptomyces sp. NPDC020996]|uniref:zinc-binding dehydrogenase n=1 Tax=Streptomyces sp. NPDC020996 TaxID=3154791 RepID=UPI0033CEF876
MPDNVPMEQAAILADAVSTPFGAVVHTEVRVGESVGVRGAGGVGTHVVQIARLVGATPVIVMDVNDEVLQRSLDLGADHAFRSDDPALQAKVAEKPYLNRT